MRSRDDLERALQTLPPSDLAGRIDTLNELAQLEHLLDRWEACLELGSEALALSVQIDDRRREGVSRLRIASAHERLGRYDIAIAQAERALELAREASDRPAQGRALSSLGGTLARKGLSDEGLARVEEALALLGEGEGAEMARCERGNIRRDRGDLDGALEDFTRAAAFYRASGILTGVAGTLAAIGTIHRRRLRFADALAAYREAAGFYERIGLRYSLAIVIQNAGNVLNDMHDYDGALAEYERSLSLRRAIADVHGIAMCLGNMGAVLLSFDRRRAIPLLREAVEAASRSGNAVTKAHALGNLGEVLIRDGYGAEARRLAEQSLSIFRATQDRRQIANLLAMIGRAILLTRDADPLPFLVEAVAVAREGNAPDALAPALSYLSVALHRAGRTAEALAAARDLSSVGTPSSRASSLLLSARCLPPAEAESLAREALDAGALLDSRRLISAAAGLLARILAVTGRYAEARQLVDEALSSLNPESFFSEREDLLEDAVFALRACGDESAAAAREAELRALKPRS
jgi:tetratricopeptide (TPR) repeat protein